jgi:hypothetical protein
VHPVAARRGLSHTACSSASSTYRSRPVSLFRFTPGQGFGRFVVAGVPAPIPDGREKGDLPIGSARRQPRLCLAALVRAGEAVVR